MSNIEHVAISIQDDFLARQTRALPIAALSELIWNSLDGEGSCERVASRDFHSVTVRPFLA